ncbi:WD40 repeat-like protein, partial [Rhizopogon vinicolor AM-OR11-026]
TFEGRQNSVYAVAVFPDGRRIVMGSADKTLRLWDKDGVVRSPNPSCKIHSKRICSLNFSPDGAVLVTGSWDTTTKVWNTKVWQMQGNPIDYGARVKCVRFSP